MTDDRVPRRSFLVSGIAALGIPKAMSVALPPRPRTRAQRPPPVTLGVASYSLRNFPRDQAIAMV